ncbi:diguanylate cyclase [Niveibacterium sp. SC-1]|uniref:diguanylate cyclase domain-containing protein n=1 Tax=Niveibacterium sp. SC-1 TaxID=3135646 RepID=UPI00311D3682
MTPPTVSSSSLFGGEIGDRSNLAVKPSQILLWACDAQGYFDFFSPSWFAFTGHDLACEHGQGWLDEVYPEDRPLLRRDILDALQRESPWRRTFRLQRHDGVHRWVLMEGMPRHAVDGHFAGFVGHCLDVGGQEAGDVAADLSASQITRLLTQTRLLAVMVEPDGTISFANERVGGLLGRSQESLRGASFFEHFSAEHLDLLPDGGPLRDFPTEFETTLRGDGRSLVLWHSMVQRDYAGSLAAVVLLGEDVTARRSEEDKLAVTSKVFESSHLAMTITDAAGTILSVNDAFTRLTGYGREEAQGQNPRILQSGRHSPEFYKEMWRSLVTSGHWHGDIWDRRKDGTIYPKFISMNAIRDEEGRTTNYSCIFSDITERKAIEEKLSLLAHLDALTRLPNRTLLRERLGEAIADAAGGTDRVALLYIDLDRFKQVNDSLGHQAGDQVLLEVARRMSDCVRSADTVARIGGDEFIVLLPRVRELENAGRIAGKIVEALKQPIALGQQEAICTPSIGISICPDHGADVEALIHCADQAMYRIKTTSRCGYHFYDQARKEA